MIKELISKVLNLGSSETNKAEIDLTDIVMPADISKAVSGFTYDSIPDPIIEGNAESKNTFLIMDDQPAVFFLYETDFKNIKRTLGIDILKDFKIVKCVGDDAGFIAHKYLQNTQDELVIALLDITLGKIIKVANEVEVPYVTEEGKQETRLETKYDILTFDGVDIALEIMDKYPKCQIKFCSAHRLNKKNPEILEFIDKFESKTKLDISDFYFSKNTNRVEHIYKLLVDSRGV